MKKKIKQNKHGRNIFELPSFDTKNGILMMAQNLTSNAKGALPFDIQRVLVMKGMSLGDIRGGHTHHKTRQILFAVSGSCTVDMDNGHEKWSVTLDTFHKGIVLEPYVWHVMRGFTVNTILLVLADSQYDESDYIRDYEEFLDFLK